MVMRTTSSVGYFYIKTLNNESIEIWNAGQKIYSGIDNNTIVVTLVDSTKDLVIKGNITEINCYKNQLSTLNVDKNINLQHLDCSYNRLTLNSIIQILKSIGKRKTNRGIYYLYGNSHTDFTQPQELVDALNVAKANGWKINY